MSTTHCNSPEPRCSTKCCATAPRLAPTPPCCRGSIWRRIRRRRSCGPTTFIPTKKGRWCSPTWCRRRWRERLLPEPLLPKPLLVVTDDVDDEVGDSVGEDLNPGARPATRNRGCGDVLTGIEVDAGGGRHRDAVWPHGGETPGCRGDDRQRDQHTVGFRRYRAGVLRCVDGPGPVDHCLSLRSDRGGYRAG